MKDETCIPDANERINERIKLAVMGLSNKLVQFNMSGDRFHIHEQILNAFPPLKDCGGYSLLRQAKGCNLICIELPPSGYTVTFLADALNRAKLFINDETSTCEVCQIFNTVNWLIVFL